MSVIYILYAAKFASQFDSNDIIWLGFDVGAT